MDRRVAIPSNVRRSRITGSEYRGRTLKPIKALLNKVRWELRGTEAAPHSTMRGGLEWLARHGFNIRTVLDVGASDGCWTRECISFFPDASYVLFEPQPVHRNALTSLAKAVAPRVIVINEAVGAFEGHAFLDASDPFGGAVRFDEAGTTIPVAVTTIDATIAAIDIAPPYLLKLDTHGFESSILTGAATALEDTEALIIEAYNHRITDEGLLFWELCGLLSSKGFRPVYLADEMRRQYDDSLWQMDLFFVGANWAGFKHAGYR